MGEREGGSGSMSSPLGLYGGAPQESPETRVLGQFSADKFSYRDQAKNLRELNTAVGFMSGMMRKMQRGIDNASQNVLQQIQGLIRELVVLVGGGGDTGFDWGDLRYVLQAWGALFGFGDGSGGISLPIDLFNAAWYFFANFIGFGGNFTDLINTLLDNFIASVLDMFGEVPIVGEALQQLAVILRNGVDWIETIGSELNAGFWDLVDNLTGGLTDVTQALAKIAEHIFEVLIQPIIDAISLGVGGIGSALTGAFIGISTNISKLFNLASGADAKASSLISPARPLWESVDGNGEVTLPLATADVTMVVDATHSRGGLIRCVGNDKKATISCIAYKTGTVSSCYFDIYRLESNGDMTLMHSSADQSSLLEVTSTVMLVEIPEEYRFTVEPETYYMVICRIGGSGSVTLQGKVFPTTTVASRPLYTGVMRNPVSDPAPATISSGTFDSLYVPETPYFQLGRTEDILPQSFFVDFSTLSSMLWVPKRVTTFGHPFTHIGDLYAEGGVLKISDEPGSGPSSGYGSITYRFKAATKNVRVGMRLAQDPSSIHTILTLFSRLDQKSFLALGVNHDGCIIYRGTDINVLTSISTNSYSNFVAGDWIYFEHDDALSTLYVYKNPDWTDPNYRNPIGSGGNLVFSIPMSTSGLSGLNTSSTARSGGVIMYRDVLGPRSAFVDDWILEDWVS